MDVDLPTLMLAASFVAAVSGMFLFFAWLQNPAARAPLWWSGANLALASGVPLVASGGASFGDPSVVFGILLLNLSPGLVWAAAVSSNGRRPSAALAAAGAALWLVLFTIGFGLPDATQMALNLGLVALYLFAAAAEFWIGNTRGFQTRRPLIVLLVLHGSFFATGAILAAAGRLDAGPPALGSWFGLIYFETLAFVVGTAIFTVAMVKERQEMAEKAAGRIDSLTGVANRRAFLEKAAAMLAAGGPLSLIVFDLDRFKSINDTFGHAAGDHVLQEFGAIVRRVLRGTDAVGRMGGEEFAIALPGFRAPAAVIVAERIRHAFADVRFETGGLRPTASAGIADCGDLPERSVDALFAAADRALYAAKANGRDRVMVCEAETGEADAILRRLAPATA